MRRREIKAQKLKRKNFFPLLIITLILWLLLGGVIYFVDPSTFGAVPLFFLIIFLTLFFTASIVFANSKRGLIITSFATFFIFLRFLGVGNLLNLVLLLGLVITIELYFSKK